MKKITIASFLLVFIPQLLLSGNGGSKNKLPIAFQENKGQFADENGKLVPNVLFKTTGVAPGIYITTSGISYVFYQKAEKESAQSKKMNWSKIDMQLEGASIKTENIKTENEVSGICNFYYAHCPQGILNVKSFQKITIASVYPGIDWVLNADEAKGLSHDFIVHPGAEASQIHILYLGANSILLQEKKSKIVLHSAYGDLFEGALNVYEKNGKKINANFKLTGNELRYFIGKHREDMELIIDPPLLWSQKEISSGIDYGNAIVCPRDGTGDVLVAGFSGAFNFPVLNATQGGNNGNDDMVIFRLNTNGTRIWSTYFGGNQFEEAKGIAADANGNCYVSGFTSSINFPTLNPIQAIYGGGTNDVAILKLNNAGVRQWATYLGGTLNDYANAIATDNAGNSYITGYTNSLNFDTLMPIQKIKNIAYDAFITKVNSTGVLQWSTYFGGDDDDKGRGITLNPSGTSVFIGGTTIAGVFPVTAGAYQVGNGSAYNVEDAFVLKMNASNASVQYCTLCGGTDADVAEDIAVDGAGNAFLTGYTFSNDYKIVNPGGGAYVDSTIGSIGTHDVFITKFNPTGTANLWSTYLGGTNVDMAFGICIDPLFGIYVTGSTSSTDFPTQLPADNVYYQSVQGDGGLYYDFFVAWFTMAGKMEWSTYFGNANSNEGRGVDTDAQSNIFITGTDSNNVSVAKFASGILTGLLANQTLTNSIKLYPQPTSGILNLEFDVKKEGYIKLEILGVDGKIIRSEFSQSVSGKNSISIDVSQMAEGSYLLKLEDAEKSSVMKFTKIK